MSKFLVCLLILYTPLAFSFAEESNVLPKYVLQFVNNDPDLEEAQLLSFDKIELVGFRPDPEFNLKFPKQSLYKTRYEHQKKNYSIIFSVTPTIPLASYNNQEQLIKQIKKRKVIQYKIFREFNTNEELTFKKES